MDNITCGKSEGIYIPVANKGVVVSLNPRKTPCMARDRRTAGEPSDLKVKYFLAGLSMVEPYIFYIQN